MAFPSLINSLLPPSLFCCRFHPPSARPFFALLSSYSLLLFLNFFCVVFSCLREIERYQIPPSGMAYVFADKAVHMGWEGERGAGDGGGSGTGRAGLRDGVKDGDTEGSLIYYIPVFVWEGRRKSRVLHIGLEMGGRFSASMAIRPWETPCICVERLCTTTLYSRRTREKA